MLCGEMLAIKKTMLVPKIYAIKKDVWECLTRV